MAFTLQKEKIVPDLILSPEQQRQRAQRTTERGSLVQKERKGTENRYSPILNKTELLGQDMGAKRMNGEE
jgi:hypothetical protein